MNKEKTLKKNQEVNTKTENQEVATTEITTEEIIMDKDKKVAKERDTIIKLKEKTSSLSIKPKETMSKISILTLHSTTNPCKTSEEMKSENSKTKASKLLENQNQKLKNRKLGITTPTVKKETTRIMFPKNTIPNLPHNSNDYRLQ